MKTKIPQTWDECKTKEQKKAFKEELERIDKTGTFRPFDDYLKEENAKEKKTKKVLEWIGYAIGTITIILLIYGIIQVALK